MDLEGAMHPLRLCLARVFLATIVVGMLLGAGPALGATASTITCTARITLTPNSGPPGSHVHMYAAGLCSLPTSVPIYFEDVSGREGTVKDAAVQNGSFTTTIRIPADAAIGTGAVSISASYYC